MFERYEWYKPGLGAVSYNFGDIYDEEKTLDTCHKDWNSLQVDGGNKYLKYVKELKPAWPHLNTLSDFMETTVTPKRWQDLYDPPATKEDAVKRKDGVEEELQRRAKKTKVCRLDYYTNRDPKVHRRDINDLSALFGEDAETDGGEERPKLRLYVIEDLSRCVIEHFGSRFGVDPSFFQSHLVDYAWCNIRDYWRDPPSLYIASQHQSWFKLRFVIPRYFATPAAFDKGTKEAETFNVFRRPDDDQNRSRWDKEAIVGITRTRASFWLRPLEGDQAKDPHRTDIGILLLDPTLEDGQPLWCHYRNWERPPPMGSPDSKERAKRKSFFEDFIYWAQNPSVFHSLTNPPSPASSPSSAQSAVPRWANAEVPMQALLHRICAEWLTMSDYVTTRLNQIELEVSDPKHFLTDGSQIDNVLKKLHTWRRSIPIYREMLAETLETVFRLSPRLSTLLGGSLDAVDPNRSPGGTMSLCVGPAGDMPGDVGGISAYRYDFALVLAHMEEHQKRIDRLASVVTAAINIEDARRGYNANKNVTRLTLLATLFVPLSLVASLFSMTRDVMELRDTAILWAEIAIPSAFGVWLIATLLNSEWFRNQTEPLRQPLKYFIPRTI
ncbi:hypothetical protein DL771_006958 [Monosporascus sp. 5C6A]|nr:hypothetical protein DL771_006958 [Monosporascus sp. 5C6A]